MLLFYLTGGFSFHFICFPTSSLILPRAITGFLHPFYTFRLAYCRMIRDNFILPFLAFSFYHECYGFRECFLLTVVFYLTLLFVTQMRAGTTLPGSLARGLELLMFELQDRWFVYCVSDPRNIDWNSATEYVLGKLCKVICKEYK